MARILLLILAILVVNEGHGLSRAYSQPPRVSETRLGVDRVSLNSGERLYGFILSETPTQIEFAVSRTWFEKTYPKLYQQHALLEQNEAVAARKKLLERLEKWIEDRKEDALLMNFLRDEVARLGARNNPTELNSVEPQTDQPKVDSAFVRLNLTRDQVRDLFRQAPDRRHIAGLAFHHQLEDVTLMPISLLAKQLESQGVDLRKEQVDLRHQLPPIAMESDRCWAARQAVVEHQLRKPVEYQGTGDMLMKAGQQPDLGQMIAQLMSGGGSDPISQLGAELGLPEFTQQKQVDRSNTWWQRAAQEAEREGHHGILVTRLKQNLLSPIVEVEAYFFAMEKPSVWFEVTRFIAKVDSSDAKIANHAQSLKENPQLKSIIDTVQALGLPVDQTRLDQAFQHGAATDSALGEVRSGFLKFAASYIKRLDSPSITPTEAVGK